MVAASRGSASRGPEGARAGLEGKDLACGWKGLEVGTGIESEKSDSNFSANFGRCRIGGVQIRVRPAYIRQC